MGMNTVMAGWQRLASAIRGRTRAGRSDAGGGADTPARYHTMRDREGRLIWEGAYDLYPVWRHFGIPDDLRNQSVVDIGSATGFFAFECEKRGATPVVSTELASIADRDVKANRQDYARQQLTATPEENQGACRELAALMGSQVRLHRGNINDPLHAALGEFDWVIFGSLMTHLKNPILALEHVRALTRGRAVVISSYLPGEPRPILRWVESDRPYDWWLPSKSLMPQMLRAVGFGRVVETGDFVLRHHSGHEQRQACWHAFP